MSDDSVGFFTDGLLSKWGFGDGDMLDDLLWGHGFGNIWEEERHHRPDDAMSFDHRVLVRVVREYVVPPVRENHEIEVYEVHTIHNPIRASVVDGVEVDDYRFEENAPLTPDVVGVSVSAILAIAEEERKRFTERA